MTQMHGEGKMVPLRTLEHRKTTKIGRGAYSEVYMHPKDCAAVQSARAKCERTCSVQNHALLLGGLHLL